MMLFVHVVSVLNRRQSPGNVLLAILKVLCVGLPVLNVCKFCLRGALLQVAMVQCIRHYAY